MQGLNALVEDAGHTFKLMIVRVSHGSIDRRFICFKAPRYFRATSCGHIPSVYRKAFVSGKKKPAACSVGHERVLQAALSLIFALFQVLACGTYIKSTFKYDTFIPASTHSSKRHSTLKIGDGAFSGTFRVNLTCKLVIKQP